MSSFADRFKMLRERTGMTQKEAAEVFGTADSTVGMWEQGRRRPPVEKMEEIADYFNVDLNYLNGKSDYTTLIVPGDVAGGYYINDDVKRIANEIAKDSDLMLLFKTAKHAGPGGVKIATDMLEALRRKEEGVDDGDFDQVRHLEDD